MKNYITSTIKFFFSINLKDLWLGLVTIVVFLLFLTLTTTFTYASDVISKKALLSHNQYGIVLYDRNNIPFFSFYQGNPRNYIDINDIPKVTQYAIVAAEDKDFYQHGGFDAKAIVRSAWTDIKQGGADYGGSTITQQLVKNSLLTPQKDLLRKYQEVVLAQEVEKNFSKDQILEMYLNTAYFGNGASGIDAAAHNYFSKDPKDLNLAESSYLASLLPAPSELSTDLTAAKQRQKYVLNNMVEKGFISSSQADQAFNQKLAFKPQPSNMNNIAEHFALMVRDQLINQYGEDEIAHSGFKVYTTLDINWQEYAENYLKNYINTIKTQHASNGAIVAIDPKTGEVLSLVGSYDWNDDSYGKVNAATTPRQPGSSFKPIVYLTAFERGAITPATQLKDIPTSFQLDKYSPPYKPHDYDYKYRGIVTPRRALANSLNIPAVEVITKVGIPSTIDQAEQMGITIPGDPSQYGPALALGAAEVSPLQMTEAYATLADNGYHNPAILIKKIIDKSGNTIFDYQPSPVEVAPPGAVYQVTSILSDNKARAEEFGNTLTINRPAAVKTGTSENNIDTWTLGYTPSLAIGVWVGNNDHSPTNNLIGALGAAPVWRNLMEHYLAGTPVEQFTPPSDLVKAPICKGSPQSEYFLPGTQPQKDCPTPTLTPTPTPGGPTTTPTPTPSPAEQKPKHDSKTSQDNKNSVDVTVSL